MFPTLTEQKSPEGLNFVAKIRQPLKIANFAKFNILEQPKLQIFCQRRLEIAHFAQKFLKFRPTLLILQSGQKSPKIRWRFLLKSCRHQIAQNRPFGEKSPQLGTLNAMKD